MILWQDRSVYIIIIIIIIINYCIKIYKNKILMLTLTLT